MDMSASIESVPKELFAGGRWRLAEDGRTFPVEDPATGKTLCEVADASPADAAEALDMAVAAQPQWAAVPARERGEILRRAYQSVIADREGLAGLITLEMGKTLDQARAEVDYGAEYLRWFSEEAVRIGGDYAFAPGGESRMVQMRGPVGPCLLITPWNFPLAMGTRKIGPAIAAGCTMLVKPADLTPLTMLALAWHLRRAGLPDGVLSVLPTTRAAEVTGPLIADGRLRKLSFTGSTGVGRLLLKQCADHVLRTSMELGGNAPFVVFADACAGEAGLDRAVSGAMQAKLHNAGQACTGANRFIVQDEVAERFAARLAERMAALTVGPGVEPASEVGPLINARARDAMTGLVDDAGGHGAKVLTGGAPVDRPGHFFEPTVLIDVPREARIWREETFGPIAPVTTFHSEDEAVALANDTEYGLAAYVYTHDLARALRVCERVESGMVALNRGAVSNPAAPFGGVKESGLGREGGGAGIEEYLETKYVAVADPFTQP